MADEKFIKRLKKRLTTEPGDNGEKILNETIRINTILNLIPYKLELLKKRNPVLAKYVKLSLRRFVGITKRYQAAVKEGNAEKIGFFKRRTLNNFRIQFESLLRKIK
ncbi:hypothetical protein GOV03_01420 [Candidatus Woesearchaeota archaeon]|nr:hypothetical protein [Candidatus Woesearchaeota archaeon]